MPASKQPMTRYFQYVTDLETMLARLTIQYPAYRGRSEHDMHHGVLHFLVARGRLSSLGDWVQPLYIKLEMYRSASELSSIRTRDERVVYPMVVQTVT
ncbi:hypothetical protein TNCV_168971 [Trichonephila clavipes]|nr:hypothetical protein TNCV_168971 [Trichonephila clavipes]